MDDGRVARLQSATRLSPVAARCLALRWDGEDLADSARWLEPSLDDLHDPMQMRNMDAALDRLRMAVRKRQRVRIITDYDVDGTTSSLILQAALRLLDRDLPIDYHIPNRFGEGYGFSVIAAKKAAEDGIGLIVTADIGVRDHAAIHEARAAGVDVLVCDHHLPAGASVPDEATVLCPPQAGDTYPNRALAACGVSLKLAQALLSAHPKRADVIQSLLKLAAIGTVADLVPLTTRENRAIVSLGLGQLNRGGHHAGLSELLRVSGLGEGEIRTSDLGYRIGPRINAAGRVADARLVVELLNTRDPARAHQLAEEIDGLNRERRGIQTRLVDEVLASLQGEPPPFVLVSGDEASGWHRGVVGIVASRVKDELSRPTAVVSVQGDVAVGSVRSVRGVHAVQALDSVADLLVKYGGHPMAAGFTVPSRHLPELSRRLSEFVAHTDAAADWTPTHAWDAALPASELHDGLRRELDRFGPFGQGNPQPRLFVQGVRPFGVQVKGADGALVKFLVPTGRAAVEAVWWRRKEHAEALRAGPIDLLVSLEEHRWNGEARLQLDVADARASVDG